MSAHLIDTHCHLDLYDDPKQVAEKANREGIYTIGVTNTPSVFEYTETLVEPNKYLRPAVGLHPQLAYQRRQELDLMWPFLERTRYVGEVGLDYTTQDPADRAAQRDVFATILERCARLGNRVITIHSRRAARDTINIIGSRFPGTIILHWFSGTQVELREAIASNYYFSVNSAMVASKKGQELICAIPRERILTETDGPFVEIDRHKCQPTDVGQIIDSISTLWQLPAEEARQRVFANFKEALS